MKHSQEPFLSLVKEAYEGTLQLPAFQREWKWERGKVISLYDSLRKQFPIGSFLFLDTSPNFDLSPKPFEGSQKGITPERGKRLTLDGQQRITAGIALTKGLGGSLRYFLDLKALRQLAEDKGIDYHDEDSVTDFVQEVDDGDNYIIASTKSGDHKTLLLEQHLLSTTYLISKVTAQKYLEEYEEKYPDYRNFMKYLLVPYFTLDNEFNCPIITLTEEESLAAVTRIFATLNTTGKRLTPVEIVTATLYAHEVNLKKQVQEYQEASDYLKNMDPNGEILLQTIALLAGKSPKKSLLPKTIDRDRFKAWHEDAQDLIDRVGEFLTNELGVGFKDTNKLIPYDSIIAPMAIAFQKMKAFQKDPAKKRSALDKLKTWFIGAALTQRYSEGVHNKQENDAREICEWIEKDDDNFRPGWLKDARILNDMKRASPNGAIGRLIKCLINLEKPLDPLESTNIGYYDDRDEAPQDHHIWPRKFCTLSVKEWEEGRDSTEYVLNIMPLGSKTNKNWEKMDPSNQISDIRNKHANKAKVDDIFSRLWLSDECVSIMERPNKTVADYYEFIDARFRVVVSKLSKYGFGQGDEEFVEDPKNEEA